MWEVRRLGDVCEFSRGLTYKKSDEVSHSQNVVLRANNISLETGCLNFDELKYIRNDISIPDAKRISKDCLLICTASGSKKHLGKIAYVDSDNDFAFGGFMGLLRPCENLDAKFLYWLTASKKYRDFIHALSDGVNINNLKFSQLSEFGVPLPPLIEQKRIVAILDEVFDGIDAAVANTKQNHTNARELFESYLNNVFTQKGDGWAESRFEDIVQDTLIGLVKSKREQGPKHPYPYVKMHNILNNNLFDGTEIANVDASDGELEKYYLQDGDFIFNTRNSHELVGKNCIYKSVSDGPVLFNNNIMRIRFRPDILPSFVGYAFSSPIVSEQLERGKSGTTNVSAIYLRTLKKVLVPHPSFKTQTDLVTSLDVIADKTQHLEAIYQQKLDALAELKQSILQKAFSGELTREQAAA